MAPPRTSAPKGASAAPRLWLALGVVCFCAIVGLVWLAGSGDREADRPPESTPTEVVLRAAAMPEAAVEWEAAELVLEAPAPSENSARRADTDPVVQTPVDPSKVVLDLRWTQGSHVEPKVRSKRWLPRGALLVHGDTFRDRALRRQSKGSKQPDNPELVVQIVGGPDTGRSVRGSAPALLLEHLHPALAVVEVRNASGAILSRRTVEIGGLRPTEIHARSPGSRWRYGGPQLQLEEWEGQTFDPKHISGWTVLGDGRRGDWRASGSLLPEDLEPVFLLEVRGKGLARLTSTETMSSSGVVGPVRLERAAELDVLLHAPDHKGQTATVWVQNAGEDFSPRAHRTQLESSVGDSPAEFHELSAGDVWVLAMAHRPYPAVGLVRHTLVTGMRDSVMVSLTPTRALEGRVHVRGVPAEGVPVELWCSRPLEVSAAYLGRAAEVYENEILPLYPPSYQRVTSDAEGRVLFADWPELDDEHWLEVLRPEAKKAKAKEEPSPLLSMLGYTAASSKAPDPVLYALLVPQNRRVFDIDLAGPPPNVPQGALRLRVHGARADTTVHVRCDGRPNGQHGLEGDILLLGPLARGTWTATVTVGGVVWLEPTEINLQGVFDLEVEAPGGAGR